MSKYFTNYLRKLNTVALALLIIMLGGCARKSFNAVRVPLNIYDVRYPYRHTRVPHTRVPHTRVDQTRVDYSSVDQPYFPQKDIFGNYYVVVRNLDLNEGGK